MSVSLPSVPPVEKPRNDQRQDDADGAATMAATIPVPRPMSNWGSSQLPIKAPMIPMQMSQRDRSEVSIGASGKI
jgi:hypothetical protein